MPIQQAYREAPLPGFRPHRTDLLDRLAPSYRERVQLALEATIAQNRAVAGLAITALQNRVALASRRVEDVDPATAREHPVATIASVGDAIMEVARGVLIAVITLIVLGELYATDIVANPTNPNVWTNMTTTFANYGVVAYTMIGLGLIAVGASVALAFFGGFAGGGEGR